MAFDFDSAIDQIEELSPLDQAGDRAKALEDVHRIFDPIVLAAVEETSEARIALANELREIHSDAHGETVEALRTVFDAAFGRERELVNALAEKGYGGF